MVPEGEKLNEKLVRDGYIAYLSVLTAVDAAGFQESLNILFVRAGGSSTSPATGLSRVLTFHSTDFALTKKGRKGVRSPKKKGRMEWRREKKRN